MRFNGGSSTHKGQRYKPSVGRRFVAAQLEVVEESFVQEGRLVARALRTVVGEDRQVHRRVVGRILGGERTAFPKFQVQEVRRNHQEELRNHQEELRRLQTFAARVNNKIWLIHDFCTKMECFCPPQPQNLLVLAMKGPQWDSCDCNIPALR